MAYSLGCDLGDDTTTWSRVPIGGDASGAAHGSVASAVGTGPDGTLQVASADAADVGDVTSGFVVALGTAEPIMVGSTPYGAEALVGCVLAEVVAVNVAQVGSPPTRVGLVHDDDLDPYRLSLLTEAARTAGISSDQLELVPRSAAAAATGGAEGAGGAGGAAGGAAAVAAASVPPTIGGAAGASTATVAGATGAVGAAGVGGAAAAGATGAGGAAAAGIAGAGVAEGGVAAGAAAAAAAAGPIGAAAGPAGAAALAGPAGAAGGPLGAAAGPAGAAAGPVGAAAGPAGAGASGAAGSAGGAAGTSAAVAAKSSLPWIPIAIGGAVAVVIAVAGIAVFAGGDDTPDAATTIEITVAAEEVVSEPVSSDDAEAAVTPTSEVTVETTTESVTTEVAGFDLSPFEGVWQWCESEDGIAAYVQYTFEATGPNELTLQFTAAGGEGVTCGGGGGMIVRDVTDILTVESVTSDGGTFTAQATTSEGPGTLTVSGDSMTIITPESGEPIPLTRV